MAPSRARFEMPRRGALGLAARRPVAEGRRVSPRGRGSFAPSRSAASPSRRIDPCFSSHAPARRGERGATLSIVAIATSLVLLALGSAYLTASQAAFRLATFRERQAKAREAAEAGLAIGMSRFAAAGAGARGEEAIGAARVRWQAEPVGPARAVVRAVGTSGAGPDEVMVTFVAEVERADGRKARVLRFARE
jgi:hypothetical protein